MSDRRELESEQDFLVRSLDDLDAEHAAGDLDDDQYRELRSHYVRRTADVARRLDGLESGTAGAPEGVGADEGVASGPAARSARRPRTGWMLSGLAAFGVLAGVLLAGSLGQRPEDGLATGAGAAPQDRGAECRGLSFSEPASAIPCYDKLLVDAPDDPEFLTYRGWAKVRSDDPTGASVDFDRVVEVAPEFADVYAFRAVVAKDRGDFVTAQAELDRLAVLDPAPTVTDTISSMGLDLEVAEGLLAPGVRDCWVQERDAITGVNQAVASGAGDSGKLADSLTELVRADQCLTEVLGQNPDDVDALVMRGLAISILYQVSLAAAPDQAVLDRAVQVLDRALILDPGNPDAALIRAAVRNMAGDPQGAKADLDVIDSRRISPLYGSIDASAIRADVQRQLDGM